MSRGKSYRAGAIGRTGKGRYGHGLHLAYKEIDEVDLVAIADPDDEGRAAAKEETGAKTDYADYRDMLEKEDLDIVSVCPRWVDCHLEMVLACADAGCHIYCEKPIAMSLEDADRIVEATDRAGVKIVVAHQGLYVPQVHEVKRRIDSGVIGRLEAFYALGTQDHRGGGEDMMVLGTHLFSLMRFFAGDVDWISAHVTAGGRDIGPEDVREGHEPIGPIAGDSVSSYLWFKSGISGHFSSRVKQSAWAPDGGKGSGMSLELVGQEGRISMKGGAAGAVRIYPFGVFTPWDGDPPWRSLDVECLDHLQGNRLAIVELMEAVEQEREPIGSARDARAALEMILGAYESQTKGGVRVSFPLAERSHPLERFKNGANT